MRTVEALLLDPATGDAIDGAATKWETWPQLPAPTNGHRMSDSMAVVDSRLYIAWNERGSSDLEFHVFCLIWADGSSVKSGCVGSAGGAGAASAPTDRFRHGEWKR